MSHIERLKRCLPRKSLRETTDRPLRAGQSKRSKRDHICIGKKILERSFVKLNAYLYSSRERDSMMTILMT